MSYRSFRLMDLLCAFPLDQFNDDEIIFLVKLMFRFANKFGYVTADLLIIKDDDDDDKGRSFFSDSKVVGKQYHHAKFSVLHSNQFETVRKTVTVDEDYEFRKHVKPDQSLPIIADRNEGLHVLESFTFHFHNE